MAVVVDHAVDDESAEVIHGRPDFNRSHRFGVTEAKKYPPFVFSVRGASCLVHKVVSVEMHWYRVGTINHGGDCLVKMKRPVMFAQTACSVSFRLEGSRTRTCHIPNPDALLCGRCHGDVATFGKNGAGTKAGIKRQEAHVKLGCVVMGY